ncbi:MAG: secretin N-terminal domain-containing protein [Candidatus Hydrogenedentota bacterium]
MRRFFITLAFALALLLPQAGQSAAQAPAAPASTAAPAGQDGRVEQAKRLARDGKFAEALSLLDSVAAESGPKADDALFQKGLILFSKMKKHEEAIAEFQRLVRLFPGSNLGDDAMYYGGYLAQYHLKDNARALELYTTGYDLYPRGDFRNAIADKMKELGGSATDLETLADSVGVTILRGESADAGPMRMPPETNIADTAPMRPRGANSVTMQFEKAPLRTFIQWVSQVTGKNFIIDDDIAGEITVYSGKPIPFNDVYRIFLSILEVKGFAAVESGNVVKIISRQTAVQSELPIVLDDDASVPTDRIVMRIFRLRSVTAGSAQQILRPLLQPTDQIVVNVETNTMIVTGPGGNIARIAELLRIIDTERTPASVRSYRIQHARAAVIAEKLNGIIAGLSLPGGSAPPFKVVVDERTNMIYVLTDDVLHDQARRLIYELDSDRASERIVKVYNLTFAKADDAVKQLKSLLGLDALDQAPDIGGVLQTVILADPRLNAISLATFAPRVVDLVDSFVVSIDRAPSDSLRTIHIIRLQNASSKELAEMLSKIFATGGATGASPGGVAADAGGPGLADKVTISSDERTNSLLVTAASVDWPKLERVIKELDIRKAQVLIDGVILETNLDEARAIGASLVTADQPLEGHTRGFVRSDPVGFLPTYQALAAQGGLTIGAVRGSIVAAMLNALLTSSKTNVLQMPQILALDNEVATLRVGNLTPVVTSRAVSADNVQIAGSSSIFQNVEYRNIGLNLRIKPHIGEKGDILIESRMEIQNRNTGAEAGLSLPVFTTREIEQKFQIADGDYIVLGGLLRTQDDFTQNETPWLARIPILGTLFKSTRSSESKTVLLIFVRPRVVTDPTEAREITEEERLQYEIESRIRPGDSSSETDKWIPR